MRASGQGAAAPDVDKLKALGYIEGPEDEEDGDEQAAPPADTEPAPDAEPESGAPSEPRE
jgi:hypothetical protein